MSEVERATANTSSERQGIGSVSVAVVSYYSPTSHLDSLLVSIARAFSAMAKDGNLSGSLTLIDNSESASLTLAQLERGVGALRTTGVSFNLLQGHGNIGYGAGHNLALFNSEADYHLILNPDVELDVQALHTGIGYLIAHPGAVLLSPAARNEAGEKLRLCKRYPSVLVFLLRGFAPAWLRKFFRARLADFEMQDLDEQQPVSGIPIVSGCFMLFRRDAVSAEGGFDERYFLYFEDFDLSLRLGRRGDVVYHPGVSIVHHGGHSARKGWRHIRWFVRSGIRFFHTHGWRWL